MSFILDALKKSETDRQRHNGPALFQVRVAPPRNALPLWAIGLAVLLAVNLVIVAWVLLRRPASPEPATAPAQAANTVPPPPVAAAAMVSAPRPAPQPAPVVAPALTTAPASGAAPAAPVGQVAGLTRPEAVAPPAAPPVAAAATQSAQAGSLTANGTAAGESEAPRAQANAGGSEKLNPDDYAPAAEPGPERPFGEHVTRATASGVPLYQDVALKTPLPTLRLDLHVFAAQPQDRFVMINMHKLHEGDSLPTEGVRVESITPGGVVLSHNGTQFLLPRE